MEPQRSIRKPAGETPTQIVSNTAPPPLRGLASLPRTGNVFLRTNLSSSALVRILAQWTPSSGTGPEADADIVERLSRWVSAFDAIELQATQQSIRGMTQAAESPMGARGRRGPPAALSADFDRARATLAGAISLEAALPN